MSLLLPDEYLTGVLAIDLDELAARGVRCLLLDMDNTVLPRRTFVVPEDIAVWMRSATQRGFFVALISNNWHATSKEVAESVGLPIVVKAMKPLPFAFFHACHRFGFRRSQTVMVGDQLATDIWGAKMAGLHTILVRPLTDIDITASWLARKVEGAVLRGRDPIR